MSVILDDVGEYIRLGKNGVDLLKSCISLLPKKQQHDAEKAISDIRQALNLAQVEAAQNLGYELCRCTFPPQIMLEKDGVKICSNCNATTAASKPLSVKGSERKSRMDREVLVHMYNNKHIDRLDATSIGAATGIDIGLETTLERLIDAGYVHDHLTMGLGTSYSITTKGMAYLEDEEIVGDK